MNEQILMIKRQYRTDPIKVYIFGNKIILKRKNQFLISEKKERRKKIVKIEHM